MNNYKREGTSLVSFFQIAISLLAYVGNFSGKLCFGGSYFFILFFGNYFDATVTFSGQPFLQNNCCFFLFQNSYFFARVIFSEQLIFRSESSTEQPLLENRKFFTAANFRNSYFFQRNCLYLKKSYFF